MSELAVAFTPPKIDLILVAERMVGELGVEGVSLRKISQAAGNGNVFAAQYHFGSREGLMQAVMQYRRPQLDRMHQEQFARWSLDLGDATLAQIAEARFRPLLDLKSEDGQRSHCRFQAALMLCRNAPDYFVATANLAPFSIAMREAERKMLPVMPDTIWVMRLRAIWRYAVSLVVEFDRGWLDPSIDEATLLHNLVVTTVAALSAPA